jgi:sulfur carrier protein
MIQIQINGEVIKIAAHSTISEMLKILHRENDKIAVALNNKVVTKSEWIHTELKESDNITIITAAYGG